MKTLHTLKITAILLVMVGGFLACKDKEKNETSDCGKIELNQNEFVTIQVVLSEDISVNSSDFSIKLIIENQTETDMVYGQAFSLEYFDKNKWTSVQLDYMFENIGYILEAGKTTETEIYLLIETAGRYRINKNVTLDKTYSLCAEFELK